MIYVDKVFEMDPLLFKDKNPRAFQASRWGNKWCHMWPASLEDENELHSFAKKIGLRRAYFQERGDKSKSLLRRFPHYDLIPSKRTLALKAGAIEIDLREWIKIEKSKE